MVVELLFKAGADFVKLIVDRNTREVHLASSKTNYKLQSLPYESLFDKGKEGEQDKIVALLSDDAFKKVIIAEFAAKGYKQIPAMSRR